MHIPVDPDNKYITGSATRVSKLCKATYSTVLTINIKFSFVKSCSVYFKSGKTL